jgi:hypothetical protein
VHASVKRANLAILGICLLMVDDAPFEITLRHNVDITPFRLERKSE